MWWAVRSIPALLFLSVYVGGVVGAFEFFERRFDCSVSPGSASRSCGLSVPLNAVLWPFELGKESARWAFEQEGARLARLN